MNIAIIGLGKIADYHIQAIGAQPNFKLVGGFDVSKTSRGKLPEGAKFYASADKLLADKNIETVALLVPAGKTKQDLGRRILRSGKNLITEKPAVSNTRDLYELQRLANERGLFIHGAFHSRFSPTAQKIHRLLENGRYQSEDIRVLEMWAESPHIIDGSIVSKSSEATSLQAEGPNIFAEALLYTPAINIQEASFVRHSDDLPEVQTQIMGDLLSGGFRGRTSWITGFKEKGVRIIFVDGRELNAIHTRQQIFNERADIIFDGLVEDPKTSRMDKEYTALYRQLATDIKYGGGNNTELIERVLRMTDAVEGIKVETKRELRPELRLPKS